MSLRFAAGARRICVRAAAPQPRRQASSAARASWCGRSAARVAARRTASALRPRGRAFSAGPEAGTVARIMAIPQAQWVRIGAGAVGVVAVYGLTTLAFDVTMSMMSMSPRDIGYYGFAAGFATAGVCAAVAYTGRRAFQLKPEEVYRGALNLLRRDREATLKLGGQVKGRGLKAYDFEGGRMAVNVETRLPEWKPPRVQMMFAVTAEKYDGIVTCEAVKKGTATEFVFAGLDVMDSSDTRLHLHGDEARMNAKKDEMRELVFFKTTHSKV